MFDPKLLSEVLDLHERAFALLRWVRAALKQGQVSFATVHQNTDTATAAAEWIQRHFNNIPRDARPEADRIAAFANLFVSFLTTSYRMSRTVMMRQTRAGCCCTCSYCSYLQAATGLQPRIPSKKDASVAVELKRIYLSDLASELEIAEPAARINGILQNADVAQDVALATWGAELVRRAEFASQGEAVLALWRQFAWSDNQPRKKFSLKASMILAAEEKIRGEFRRVT